MLTTRLAKPSGNPDGDLMFAAMYNAQSYKFFAKYLVYGIFISVMHDSNVSTKPQYNLNTIVS